MSQTDNNRNFLIAIFGKTDSTTVQILRNAVVEFIRYGTNIAILWYLNERLFGPDWLALSTFLASLLSGLVNYGLCTIWVFHKKTSSAGRNLVQFAVFTLVGALGLAINIGITTVLTNRCGVYFLISNTIAQVTVFFFNFFVRKKLVFSNKSGGEESNV
ncbi:MAG: GtrA family protein [Salinivirgaceae bacterium]|nr:GtrA family protein [Salinivirgaceae bacterium]